MDFLHLIVISLVAPVGVAYLYLGILRNDCPFLVGGPLLAVYPFFIRDVRLLFIPGAILIAAPFLVRKVVERYSGEKKGARKNSEPC